MIFTERRLRRGRSRPLVRQRKLDAISFGFPRVAREKSNSSGERREECRRESDIRMSRARANALARYAKIGTRWRHKRKKHKDASPLRGGVLFSTVMSDAIISGSVNALAMKALMTSHRELRLEAVEFKLLSTAQERV